jgi:hypothetical protein
MSIGGLPAPSCSCRLVSCMGFTIAPSPFRNRRAEASADLITDNGQIERINRTIMDTIVKRYHHNSRGGLVRRLDDFVAADTFALRLKTLNGTTPYEFVCKR